MIKQINDKTIVYSLLKSNFLDYVALDDPFEKVFVYEKEYIIGLISISIIYDRAEINYIVVNDEYRNMGIGSKLLSYAILFMKKYDVTNVSLEVSVNNKPAISLYKKYGFKDVAIRKNYYGNDNAYLMVKDLRC